MTKSNAFKPGLFGANCASGLAVTKAKALHDAGIDGMAFGLIDYIAELLFFQKEVLPRMARLGLRGLAQASERVA